MSALREMVLQDAGKNLEKLHDSVAQFNEDLRYMRGIDLEILDDEQLAIVKQITDQAAGIAIMQLMLNLMLIKKLKEEDEK